MKKFVFCLGVMTVMAFSYQSFAANSHHVTNEECAARARAAGASGFAIETVAGMQQCILRQ